MLNVGFMKKYISSGIWEVVAIQYQLITKHFDSNIVLLAPLPNHFSLLNINDMDYSLRVLLNLKRW